MVVSRASIDVQAQAAKRKLGAERMMKYINSLNEQQHIASQQCHTEAQAKLREIIGSSSGKTSVVKK